MADDHDALASQLLEFVPGATFEQAIGHLSANDWNLDAAAASLMADLEEGEGEDASAAPAPTEPAYTGPRTLDGRPAPQSASASRSSKKPAKKTGLATLSSLGGGSHGHDHEDDDSEEDEDDAHRRDTYAGGEKSGLALQDPNRPADPKRVINDIVAKAKQQAQLPPRTSPAGPPSPSTFRGAGQTLGGDGVASRTIPDPRGPPAARAAPIGPVRERVLHLWHNGYSVDSEELHRFDDPANQADLRLIQQGEAPRALFNIQPGEELDVKLEKHDEPWRQLPREYRPFSGEGRRLGSPVPSEIIGVATQAAPVQSISAIPAAAPSIQVDESQPSIMIRIQMADGTRLPARFNTRQTIGDVYSFISRASNSLPAGWILATTFPNKDHTDKSLVLGDMAEFKKGGTAVVKKP